VFTAQGPPDSVPSRRADVRDPTRTTPDEGDAVNDTPADTIARRRDVEREAREFLEYHLLPLHTVVGRLEDGIVPAFSSRFLVAMGDCADPAPRGRHPLGHAVDALAMEDPDLHAAVTRLRRAPWFRLRFAWARLRGRDRHPL
jgi:hypothetical protein